MKKPRGTDVVAVIQRLVDDQTRDSQQAKQLAIEAVLGGFAQNHGIAQQGKAITTLAKLLRNEDATTIRQVRTLSDALLLKDERTLDNDLKELRKELGPIEATFHQVKTKNAFISAVLRPFSPKFTAAWFSEREDIDIDQLQKTIQRLESNEIGNLEELNSWIEEVAALFEQLVVYRGEDADNYYARPSGTVSLKSSRTYLQAWIAFTEKSKQDLWSLLTLGEKTPNKAKDQISSSASQEDGLDQYAPPSREPTRVKSAKASRNKTESSFSMMMAPPAADRGYNSASTDFSRESVTANKTRATSKPQQGWVEIFIESKLDSSAQATRRWDSSADFRVSIQKWLDTLPVIWGAAADSFVAKVSVKNNTGQSDLTLPSLTAYDAAKRITQAVEMQSE